MKSMTGYGKASLTRYDISIDVEIKSINARYLDLKLYIPRDLSYAEFNIRKMINKALSRGTLEVRINYTDHREPNIELNIPKLMKYNDIIKTAMNHLGSDEQVPIEILMKEPGIIESNRKLDDDQDLNEVLIECIKLAIDQLDSCLVAEGEDIRNVLSSSLSKIQAAIQEVEKQIPIYKSDLFENMKKRILDILGNVNADVLEQRLIQELAVYIDKYDVQEEITRLRSHILTFMENLDCTRDGDIGKNLNFIMQEMQREANTLGSKFSTPQTFRYILIIKEEVETCREIIQNVA